MWFLVFMLLFASVTAQQPSEGGTRKEERVSDAATNTLQSSRDPKQLLQAALALARSNQVQDHDNLSRWLSSSEFLSRLDSEKEYASTGRRLRIAMVLQALAMNAAPSARAVLVSLSQSQEFLAMAPRVDFLIQYSYVIRPAPDELVRFWDAYCQPDDGFANLTVATLVANGTDPALRLLERKFRDSKFAQEDKLSWIESNIYAHRIEMPVLLFCERLIGGNVLSSDLELPLAEVLFDPKPQRWFSPATVIVPPPLEQASAEAKTALQRIGTLVLQSHWATPELRGAVPRTLAAIGK
jgi:hypothetical protein